MVVGHRDSISSIRGWLLGGIACIGACSNPPPAPPADPDEKPLTKDTDPTSPEGKSVTSAESKAPGAPSAGCAQAPSGDRKGITIDVGGHQRRYDLSVPPAYDAKQSYPLVFVFHGGGGNAEDARTTFDFARIAPDKALFVYPTGEGGNWDLDSPTSSNDDIAFFDAMVASLSASHCVDRSRVFATGYSMGGYFSNQLGCRRGDVLRAIAPHAGGGPFDGDDAYDDSGHLKCNGKAVAAMVFHGIDDDTVSVDEGKASVAHWRWANGCQAKSTPTTPAPCVTFEGCKSPVAWCRLPGVGHDVWENGPRATWEFFSRF